MITKVKIISLISVIFLIALTFISIKKTLAQSPPFTTVVVNYTVFCGDDTLRPYAYSYARVNLAWKNQLTAYSQANKFGEGIIEYKIPKSGLDEEVSVSAERIFNGNKLLLPKPGYVDIKIPASSDYLATEVFFSFDECPTNTTDPRFAETEPTPPSIVPIKLTAAVSCASREQGNFTILPGVEVRLYKNGVFADQAIATEAGGKWIIDYIELNPNIGDIYTVEPVLEDMLNTPYYQFRMIDYAPINDPNVTLHYPICPGISETTSFQDSLPIRVKVDLTCGPAPGSVPVNKLANTRVDLYHNDQSVAFVYTDGRGTGFIDYPDKNPFSLKEFRVMADNIPGVPAPDFYEFNLSEAFSSDPVFRDIGLHYPECPPDLTNVVTPKYYSGMPAIIRIDYKLFCGDSYENMGRTLVDFKKDGNFIDSYYSESDGSGFVEFFESDLQPRTTYTLAPVDLGTLHGSVPAFDFVISDVPGDYFSTYTEFYYPTCTGNTNPGFASEEEDVLQVALSEEPPILIAEEQLPIEDLVSPAQDPVATPENANEPEEQVNF